MAGEIPVFCAFDEIVPLDDLRPNPKNPNRHPGDQVELLARVIKEQGWRQPVKVSTRSGLIVSGHGRYEAALLLGCPVPVDFQNYPGEAEELADLLADNRIAEMAEMDAQALAALFSEFDESDIDISLSGYDADAVEQLRVELPADNDMDMEKADEDVPEIPFVPVTQPGDLWKIGVHRLVCGDSTKGGTYAALMQSEVANLIVTDPPYNVDYEGSAGKIQNDNMDSAAFRAFLRDMYTAAAAVTEKGAAAYIFHADGEGVAFREEFQRAGFLLKQCLIWVKNSFVLGRQDYQWRHEPILYGWKSGAAHYFTNDRSISTVFDGYTRPDFGRMNRDELAEFLELIYDGADDLPSSILYCDKPTRNADHPTMKPTALIGRLVENSSRRGGIVLDPFGGSGSTLIACEALGRKARTIELDPRFADVIVRRYVRTTGKMDVVLVRAGEEISVTDTGILTE